MSETLARPISIMRQDVSGGISVEVATTFEQLASIQTEWDDFMESINGEIFLTFDWCRIWWKYYGQKRELIIFQFRKDGKIIGILPLFSEKIRLGPIKIGVIKIVGTDFMPITTTIPLKKEFLNQIIHILFQKLNNQIKYDIFHIGAICGRYDADELITILKNDLSKTYYIRIKENDVQTYFEIAPSWEEQLSRLSSQQRRSVKRYYENILKQGRSLECIPSSTKTFDRMYDDFVSMHQEYWRRLGMGGHFADWPLSYEFHREIGAVQLKRQRLRLYMIKLDGNCIGYNYGYKFGDTYYLFLNPHAQIKSGEKIDFWRIYFGEMVKLGIREQIKWFDTMRGRYEYKLHLGGKLFPINNIYVCRKNVWINPRVCVFRLLATGLDVLYNKIWRRRLAPLFRLGPRPFPAVWIKSQIFSYRVAR